MQTLQSIILPLDQLERNKGQIEGLPKNPRIIKNSAFDKLKKSILDNPEMLAYREILVFQHDGRYVIIGGNMRFEALREIGYKEAICKVLPATTTVEQLRAYTIKDNASFGEWNFDDLANQWDAALLAACDIVVPELEKAALEEEAEEDNADLDELLPKEPKTKPGDMFRLGDHRLICGDSTDPRVYSVLLDGKKANLVVTDPPYNVNYEAAVKMGAKSGRKNAQREQSCIANDNLTPAAYREFLNKVFACISENMMTGAGCYVWHASKETIANIEAMENNNIAFKQQLIWVKNGFVLGRQDYQWKHEPCLYGWKNGGSHYFINKRDERTVIEDQLDFDNMSKAELLAFVKELHNEDLNPTSVIHEDKPLHSDLHPTMKPLKLIGRLVRNSSRRGDIVMDPFGGSGSTLMAAEQLGRKCYTIELDPRYCDAILQRFQDFTGVPPQWIGNINATANSDNTKI